MTKEQREFKIKRRNGYEDEISLLRKKEVFETFLFGFAAAVALFNFSLVGHEGIERPVLKAVSGLFNVGFSATALKRLIGAISRKTMLESKVEDIMTELVMPEDEESRGMKK